MADNQGFDEKVKNYSDNLYRDIGERQKQQRYGDETLLKNLDISKLAEDEAKEQTRRKGVLSNIDRSLMNKRIREMKIEGFEQFNLPEDMTYGQVEDDKALKQLFGDLIELKNEKKSGLNLFGERQISLAEEQARIMNEDRKGRLELDKQKAKDSLDLNNLTNEDRKRRLELDKQKVKDSLDLNNLTSDNRKRRLELDKQKAKDSLDLNNKRIDAQERIAGKRISASEKLNKYKQEKAEQKEARPSEKVVERLGVIDNALLLIERIEKEKPQYDTGRAKAGWNSAKGLIGEDDPKFTAFASDVNRNLANYIRMISGAAAANNERQFLAGIEVSVFDDDDTFNLKLQKAKEGFIQTRDLLTEGQKFLGKNMPERPSSPKSNQFPKKVFKDGQQATISSEKELKEAQADGWK
jgi:hypothetical protein